MTLLERFLMWLPCFSTHTIRDAQGDAYLLRKYLLPKRFTGAWWPGVFLHKFYQSDSDRCPHNHPWRWAVSLILTGGYREKRFRLWGFPLSDQGASIVRMFDIGTRFGRWVERVRRPWSFNVIRATDYHKAELLEPKRGCWTLFIAFGHKQAEPGAEWGFIDPDTGVFTGWKDYLPAGADGLEGD